MQSIEALGQLRAARAGRQKERAQCEEIKRQLEKIVALRREKEELCDHLQRLTEGDRNGGPLDTSQDASVSESRSALRDLKEKIAACRVMGPCGLTVLEVDWDCLVVSFTGLWKSVAQSFVLNIASTDGRYKVRATTVPYFIDVHAMLEKTKTPEWSSVMDDIARLLSAYVQRKGELEEVKAKYKDILRACCVNDAVTSLELSLLLAGEGRDASHAGSQSHAASREACVYLTYPDLKATQPAQAEFTADESVIPPSRQQQLREQFLTQPLAVALLSVVSERPAAQEVHDAGGESEHV
ncbi:uncharacterized protein LOC101860787 [Aplysia californica]|uniref:Uncharacterized protein LOC101860787 n=1 Tax=Aplysia californica TaxID=6500 RepID=A0ABM0JDV0_APLCA|nr:uncharacterized protein LOC101860787 [Aplysia californica]